MKPSDFMNCAYNISEINTITYYISYQGNKGVNLLDYWNITDYSTYLDFADAMIPALFYESCDVSFDIDLFEIIQACGYDTGNVKYMTGQYKNLNEKIYSTRNNVKIYRDLKISLPTLFGCIPSAVLIILPKYILGIQVWKMESLDGNYETYLAQKTNWCNYVTLSYDDFIFYKYSDWGNIHYLIDSTAFYYKNKYILDDRHYNIYYTHVEYEVCSKGIEWEWI